MQKLRFTAIICALLVSLCACEHTALPNPDSSGPTDVSAPDSSAADTDTAPTHITDDEIYSLLTEAEEIYMKMSLGSLETINGGEGIIADGQQFFPVRDYLTRDELLSYLRGYFSQSVAEAMLGSFYRDIDGRLHTVPCDRGSNIRAGGIEYTIERVGDDRVKITRYVGVWEDKACGERVWGITYNVGRSPTELMLVWDDDRWVFENFREWDRLFEYDNGGGVRYDYAESIVDAIIARDSAVSARDGGEYDYRVSLSVGDYKNNDDGSVTATLSAVAYYKDERKTLTRDYTFVRLDDGTWDFANTGYDLPEWMFQPDNTTAPFFDRLTNDEPSQDDIERLVSHADLIWGAVYTTSMRTVGGEEDALYVDGTVYKPVCDYESANALMARFRECFSEEFADKLLDYALSGPLTESDGRLYTSTIIRNGDMRAGKTRLTAKRLSDTEITVTRWVEVSEYDEAADGFVPVGESPQELRLIFENGAWVFDNFASPDDLSAYDNQNGVLYEREENPVFADNYPDTAPPFEILTAPGIPSEEDIMRVFSHADLIWSAIDLGFVSMIYDEAQAKEFEGMKFYPLRDYETIDDFRERLRECFTDEFTSQVIERFVGGADEGKAFYEVCGKMYSAGYAGVTSPVAGQTETIIEPMSDTAVKITRWVEVYDYEDDNRYLVGKSPQVMMLVYENGRWAFESFTMWDDTSVYQNGGGIRYK